MFRGSEFRVQEANAQPNTDVENQPWTKPLGPCTGVDTDGHYYGEDTAPVFVCPNVTDLYRVGASLVPGRSQYYYELSQPLFTVWGNQPTTEDYAHPAVHAGIRALRRWNTVDAEASPPHPLTQSSC